MSNKTLVQSVARAPWLCVIIALFNSAALKSASRARWLDIITKLMMHDIITKLMMHNIALLMSVLHKTRPFLRARSGTHVVESTAPSGAILGQLWQKVNEYRETVFLVYKTHHMWSNRTPLNSATYMSQIEHGGLGE